MCGETVNPTPPPPQLHSYDHPDSPAGVWISSGGMGGGSPGPGRGRRRPVPSGGGRTRGGTPWCVPPGPACCCRTPRSTPTGGTPPARWVDPAQDGGGEGRGSDRTVLIWSEYCVQIDRSRKIKKIDYFVIVYLWPGGFNRGTQNSVLRWFFSNHAFRPPRAGPGSWHPPRGLRGPASGPDGDVPPRRCPGGRGWDPPGRRVVRPAWRRRSPSASASRAARWYCGPPLAREGRRGMPVRGGAVKPSKNTATCQL